MWIYEAIKLAMLEVCRIMYIYIYIYIYTYNNTSREHHHLYSNIIRFSG